MEEKTAMEVLEQLSTLLTEGSELYLYKHAGSESKSRQRAYYKGKYNAFLDMIGAVEKMKENFYKD